MSDIICLAVNGKWITKNGNRVLTGFKPKTVFKLPKSETPLCGVMFADGKWGTLKCRQTYSRMSVACMLKKIIKKSLPTEQSKGDTNIVSLLCDFDYTCFILNRMCCKWKSCFGALTKKELPPNDRT